MVSFGVKSLCCELSLLVRAFLFFFSPILLQAALTVVQMSLNPVL